MIPDGLTPVAGQINKLVGQLTPAEHQSDTGEPSHGALLTRLIENEAEFESLEGPWSALAASCGARPFQGFAWSRAWIHTIGRTDGRQLRIATLWKGTQLVAILPLVRKQYFGVRLLEWIGARAADYCDVLLDPSVDAGSALPILWHAVAARADCDVIRLGQVREDAKIHALFAAAQLNPWVETREQTCFIPIRWQSGAEWLQAQGAHARKQAKYDLRHLAKAGFEYYVWKSPDPYEPIVEALISQKNAWLARRGFGPLLSHRAGAAFLRECIAEMAAGGTLHLSALRSRRGFAACHLGFYQQGVLYGYMPTYDLQWAASSAGAAIRDSLIMWACDHGVQRIDLMRGVESYKRRYEPEHESLQTLVIPRTLIGRACLRAYRLKQRCGGSAPLGRLPTSSRER